MKRESGLRTFGGLAAAEVVVEASRIINERRTS